MDSTVFEKLYTEGLISETSLQKVQARSRTALFSVQYELKTILYLGVLLLSTGLGILIYKNIDTIGHQAVLMLILLISGVCFSYCIKVKQPFSVERVKASTPFSDYILLLGCLTFITLIGYSQLQFTLFGQRMGLVFFIPMVVLLFSAYYFDHLGVLTLGITNLAAWCGIALTPDKIISQNDFSDERVIVTALLLGALLVGIAYWSKRSAIKEHFAFTYSNFGAHLLFIAALAGMFSFYSVYALWFLLLLGIALFFYRKALQERSFYFILIVTLYSYIGMSYVFIMLLEKLDLSAGIIYLGFLYMIASAAALIFFLITQNKKLKAL